MIHGEADPLISITAGREVAEAIPKARFVGLPDMGHDLTHQAIQEILAGLIGATPSHE